MDLDALDRVRRLSAFPGLKTGWSSELSPRARAGRSPRLREASVDEVRIEVFDVSAHIVDTASAEAVDISDTVKPERLIATEKLGAHLSGLGRLQGTGGLGEDAVCGQDIEVECSKHSEPGWDLHRRRQGSTAESGVSRGTAGLQILEESIGETLKPASSSSGPFSSYPSPQDNAMVDSLFSTHDRRPNGTTQSSESGPSYRSKTPPRLKVPFRVGGDKPLSPTQSLPVLPNGFHSSRCNLIRDNSLRKEHVVNIPANYLHKANGNRKEDERLHHSNGYVSETGQARADRQHPPIKASSKKPPRCPTSHNGVSSDSGQGSQHGRRRRESVEMEKGKARRGAGAAKWKMRLVTAILLACFTTLVYFQVFYMRPQQLQAILEGATQKEVMRAGLVNAGKRNVHGEGIAAWGNWSNTTEGATGARRKLLGKDMMGGWGGGSVEEGLWWVFGQGSARKWGKVFEKLGGLLGGGGARPGRRLLAEGGGQRHERVGGDWPREGVS